MPAPAFEPEALAAPPAASPWGRNTARTYLAVVAVAFALVIRELVTGQSGTGTFAVSILAAPWSVLLAYVARAAAPMLPPLAMRITGLVLVLLATLLNARILYGMAARLERDVRAPRSTGDSTHG
jgi:hypothetical protein